MYKKCLLHTFRYLSVILAKFCRIHNYGAIFVFQLKFTYGSEEWGVAHLEDGGLPVGVPVLCAGPALLSRGGG
jgi:hypothetical protein